MRIPDPSRLTSRYEIPASGHIHWPLVSEMGLIAMQKVVGSNPISRFFANPLHVGGSARAGNPESTGTIPAYRRHFGN